MHYSSSGPIVVIEHDDATRALIAMLLEDEGYTVVCFATTRDAWTALSHDTRVPCLILLDLFLMHQDPLHLRALLNDDPRFAHVPVVVLSAFAVSTTHILNTAGDPVLFKPFHLDTLLTNVAHFMDSL